MDDDSVQASGGAARAILRTNSSTECQPVRPPQDMAGIDSALALHTSPSLPSLEPHKVRLTHTSPSSTTLAPAFFTHNLHYVRLYRCQSGSQ